MQLRRGIHAPIGIKKKKRWLELEESQGGFIVGHCCFFVLTYEYLEGIWLAKGKNEETGERTTKDGTQWPGPVEAHWQKPWALPLPP